MSLESYSPVANKVKLEKGEGRGGLITWGLRNLKIIFK